MLDDFHEIRVDIVDLDILAGNGIRDGPGGLLLGLFLNGAVALVFGLDLRIAFPFVAVERSYKLVDVGDPVAARVMRAGGREFLVLLVDALHGG